MQIHVYDTHVHTTSGQYIHFDVLVSNENVKQVGQYAEAIPRKLRCKSR